MLELEPDFVGSWYEGPFQKSIIRGKFYMYIQEKSPIYNNVDANNDNNIDSTKEEAHSISGIIIDELGKASFEGQMSAKHIKFKLTYIDSHIKNFNEFEQKFYMGKLMSEHKYGGFYGYADEELKCIEYYRTLKFILKKPPQPNDELIKNINPN
jgi:hypothetical protein